MCSRIHGGVQGHQDDDIPRPDFGHYHMQNTMHHLYLDDLSRNSDTKIAGRGVAMTAASICSQCGNQGHYAPNCWKRREDYDSISTGAHSKQKNGGSSKCKAAFNVEAEHKWCSVHKPISHDDTECYKQGAPRPPHSGRAHHCPCCTRREHTRPNNDRNPSINFDDGFKQEFAFTGLLVGSGNRGFQPNGSGTMGLHPNRDRFTMTVGSGASSHLIYEELIPRLRKSIRDYKMLKETKAIMTNGNKKVFATARGNICGYIIDQAGKSVPARISAMFVPGLGRNILLLHQCNVIRGKHLEAGNPHLQFKCSSSLPLTQRPEDKGVCSYDVFLRTLGGTAFTSSAPSVVPAAQASNDANRGDRTFAETKQFCTNSSITMEHTTTVTPQQKRISARYGQNIATQKECTPTGGNTTPEEATATETERQHAQIPDITPNEAGVTETERSCALVQVMLHYSPVDAHSTTAGAAPDVPHHETARTRPNPRVEGTFDNTHATESSGTTPPTACEEFTYAEGDPFRISKGENRVIKIPDGILRCHPLHGSASPGITGTGITGAGITGPTASHGTIGVAGSSPSGTNGPSVEPTVDGSTTSASPGIAPATLEPSSTTRPTVRSKFTRS